jgi:integrase
LRQEADEWLAGAREGRIPNRQGRRFKPSAVRIYKISLDKRVLPEFGDKRLGDIDHADLLWLKEELFGGGCSASTIRNTFTPLQAIFRRARKNGTVAINPALDLELPKAGSRKRAARPEDAAELMDVLGEDLRPLWATAFYTGLRRGELRALRVRNVDLLAAMISVEEGWDDEEGEILPKSEADIRKVFVLEALRPLLAPLVEDESPMRSSSATTGRLTRERLYERRAEHGTLRTGSDRRKPRKPKQRLGLWSGLACTRRGTRFQRGSIRPG